MSVRVRIENNKNQGTGPNTSVTLSTGVDAKAISTLTFDPKPTSWPQVMATNMTHDAQGVIVTFAAGTTNKVEIKAGEYKSILPDSNGPAIDISACFLSARKA